jgi:hypothetical protein
MPIQTFGPFDVDVVEGKMKAYVAIDTDKILDDLARKAFWNKSKASSRIHGGVVVKVFDIKKK